MSSSCGFLVSEVADDGLRPLERVRIDLAAVLALGDEVPGCDEHQSLLFSCHARLVGLSLVSRDARRYAAHRAQR